MGRRRTKVVKIPKKKLPKIFTCPKCGEDSVRIMLERENSKALVKCGNDKCNLQDEIAISRAEEAIDAYCRFSDRFYSERP
jgi:transcription elongation factor Elf1